MQLADTCVQLLRTVMQLVRALHQLLLAAVQGGRAIQQLLLARIQLRSAFGYSSTCRQQLLHICACRQLRTRFNQLLQAICHCFGSGAYFGAAVLGSLQTGFQLRAAFGGRGQSCRQLRAAVNH
ncbi:hypothetical protein D3C75_822480 [compost metagenome]